MITGTLIEIKTGQPVKWHEVQAAVYAWLIGKNWKWDPASPSGGRLITDNPDFKRIDNPNANEHRYVHAKAKKIFSITQVCTLGSWQYTDSNAAYKGTWIHQAINLFDQGKFTYTKEDVPIEIWKKLDAYRRFLDENEQLNFPGIHEVPLCGKVGNKGTYVAGTFDKYIPGNWPLEICLLYLRDHGSYKIVSVDAKKINYYMSKFRHALEWLEFIK